MERLFIKICGITNVEDALSAVESGADALGFNFFPNSKRFIVPEKAGEILSAIRASIARVGVFVNPERTYVHAAVRRAGLNAIQFSGNETPPEVAGYHSRIFKAIHVSDAASLQEMKSFAVDAFLLDTHRQEQFGGTGETFDWDLALRAKEFGKVILAGGLTPENVVAAVRSVRPFGVDVCSGVELQARIKDKRKMREFIERAREAHAESEKTS